MPMPFEVASKQIKKTKEEILEELKRSLQKKNAIGICILETNDLITTAVVDIEEVADGDYLITLMDYDLHGFPLQKNRILLSGIQSVIRFNIPFDDPQYVKVRRKEKFKA
jgi:hypothetical protein